MDQVSAPEQTSLKEVALWEAGLATLHSRIAPHFTRPEPRRRVLAYLKGLLGTTKAQANGTLERPVRGAPGCELPSSRQLTVRPGAKGPT
jgi:hypothetical protein